MLTVTNPFGQTLTYGYDPNSNVTSVSDSLGGQVTSVLDAAQRLTSRQFSGPNSQQARLDLGYTADGQLSTLTRYSNLSGTTKVGLTQNTYDSAGNLTHIQHQNGSNGVLLDLVYSYDTDNRLSSQTVSGTTTNYGYDRDSQLTSAGSSSYSFDANGNRNMSGYVSGVANRLLSDGTWTYQYDAAGNITSKRNVQSGETWTYTVDLDNKQTSAVHKDASGNVLASETMKYDGFGQLIEQDVTNGQTTVTKFGLDLQGNVWADLNSSNQLVMRRLYLDGPNAVFARIDASGNVSWYLADHVDSIVGLTNASGSLSDQITYDAWGNFSETQPANGDREKFATYQYDAVQGDYFAQARRYDPKTGRFESIDPLGFDAGDANTNRYVGNDPTNRTDPSGLDPDEALKREALEEAISIVVEYNRTGTVHPVLKSLEETFPGLHRAPDPVIVRTVATELERLKKIRASQTSTEYRKQQAQLEADRARLQAIGEGLAAKQKALENGDGFWQVVAGGARVIQVTATVAYPPSALAFAGLYAVAGDEKRAGGALVEGAESYAVGKALHWGGRLAGRVGGKLFGRSAAKGEALAEEGAAAAGKVAPRAGKFINCFPADTLVATENGPRPIHAVRASERVWAFDLVAGEWKLRHVIETYQLEHDGDMVAVTVAGEVIEATGHHPFWVVRGESLDGRPRPEHVPGNPVGCRVPGRWVDAIDLRVGDVLLLRSGEQVAVTRLMVRQARESVYNFHVENLYCYAVGHNQILVHNNSGEEVAAAAAKGFKNLECEQCAESVQAA